MERSTPITHSCDNDIHIYITNTYFYQGKKKKKKINQIDVEIYLRCQPTHLAGLSAGAKAATTSDFHRYREIDLKLDIFGECERVRFRIFLSFKLFFRVG